MSENEGKKSKKLLSKIRYCLKWHIPSMIFVIITLMSIKKYPLDLSFMGHLIAFDIATIAFMIPLGYILITETGKRYKNTSLAKIFLEQWPPQALAWTVGLHFAISIGMAVFINLEEAPISILLYSSLVVLNLGLFSEVIFSFIETIKVAISYVTNQEGEIIKSLKENIKTNIDDVNKSPSEETLEKLEKKILKNLRQLKSVCTESLKQGYISDMEPLPEKPEEFLREIFKELLEQRGEDDASEGATFILSHKTEDNLSLLSQGDVPEAIQDTVFAIYLSYRKTGNNEQMSKTGEEILLLFREMGKYGKNDDFLRSLLHKILSLLENSPNIDLENTLNWWFKGEILKQTYKLDRDFLESYSSSDLEEIKNPKDIEWLDEYISDLEKNKPAHFQLFEYRSTVESALMRQVIYLIDKDNKPTLPKIYKGLIETGNDGKGFYRRQRRLSKERINDWIKSAREAEEKGDTRFYFSINLYEEEVINRKRNSEQKEVLKDLLSNSIFSYSHKSVGEMGQLFELVNSIRSIMFAICSHHVYQNKPDRIREIWNMEDGDQNIAVFPAQSSDGEGSLVYWEFMRFIPFDTLFDKFFDLGQESASHLIIIREEEHMGGESYNELSEKKKESFKRYFLLLLIHEIKRPELFEILSDEKKKDCLERRIFDKPEFKTFVQKNMMRLEIEPFGNLKEIWKNWNEKGTFLETLNLTDEKLTLFLEKLDVEIKRIIDEEKNNGYYSHSLD